MKKLLMTLTLALAAAIAIPTAANAQEATSTGKKECIHNCQECTNKCEKGLKAEKTKDCKANCKDDKCKAENCKDCKNGCAMKGKACKKEGKVCAKDDKVCANDGKACAKDGKRHMKAKEMPGKRMNGHMMRGGENPMMKGITLSADQQKKLEALREKAPKPGNMNGAPKSPEEMKKFHEEYEKEIEKILDKDQLKQFKANKEAMESMRKKRQK